MRKHLVLIGGGHAHMMVLASIGEFVARGHGLTVIAPSPYHYYSGMGPGMLAGTYRPEEIRFATRQVVEKQGGVFVDGRAARIDAGARSVLLDDGRAIAYDILSCNAGSSVPHTLPVTATRDVVPVKPIEGLWAARKRLLALTEEKNLRRIAVIGGGPSAVEIAGNAWGLLRNMSPHPPQIRIFAGKRLMARLPEPIRARVRRSLARRDIGIDESAYVREIREGRVVLDSGDSWPADFFFLASGIRPPSFFADSGLPIGPDGGLLVNRYLQCIGHPEIFGGGDCIHFADQPLDKVGVYAVRQNPVLRHNLLAALEGRPLMPFSPGGDYLLIYNLGDGTGVLRKKWLVFDGRLAFFLKDRIDRRFMRRFQSLEQGG